MSNFSDFISSLSQPAQPCVDDVNNDNVLTFETIKSNLENKHLKVRWFNNLFIVTYPKRGTPAAKDLDVTDPLVRECRGLIVNKNSPFNVVCKGFNMFEDSDNIPKDILEREDGEITTTIDGSYIRVYFNVDTQKWCVATNRCIEARKARWHSYRTFYDYFQDASISNDSLLDFSRLNKEHIYLFVVCHPENRIVKIYSSAMLYHIGTFDRENEWKEIIEDIGIPTPPEVDKSFFESVDKMKEHVNGLDWQFPGYVTKWVDENGQTHRAKIRNIEYEHVNGLRGSKRSAAEHYLDLRNDPDNSKRFIEFTKYYPEYSVIEDSINMVIRSVHYQYMAYYVNRTIQFVQDRTTWRLLSELHTRYIRTREATTLDIVQQYIRSMPNAELAKLLTY